VALDFREFIRLVGFTHVRTSPYYPQSNGKIERWFVGPKAALRKRTPLSVDDALRVVAEYINYYNNIRLHSAIGYVTPHDKLTGRAPVVLAARENALTVAQERRASYWMLASEAA
jgi:transposase InsO family protein